MNKTLYHFHSLSRVLLVIGIVIVINIVISGLSLRVDLTQGKLYTISRSTKDIVKNLKNPITLKVYFSDANELPDNLISVRQDTYDLIDEYQKLSRNITVEKINPSKDNKIAQEAYSFGIYPQEYSKLRQREFALKSVFAGVAITYKDKFTAVPKIEDINNLEYEITAGIQKMTQEKIPTIGIVSGHGENFSNEIQEVLRKQYEVKDVTLSSYEKIPDSFGALLIVGPTQDFTDKEKFVLDQFVMAGGRLFVLMDGTTINNSTLSSSPNNVSLNSLLEGYGVKVNQDVILDPLSNVVVPFQSDKYIIPLAYPPFPKIVKKGLNSESVITEKIPSLSFPFPSSLTLSKKPSENETSNIIELAKTSKKSFTIDGNNAMLAPNQLKNIVPSSQEERPVVVLVSGKIESAFKGKQIPAGVDTKDKISSKDSFISETENGAVLVASSSRFVDVDVLKRQFPDNFALLANALDVLVQGQSLVDIRSRSLADRPLTTASEEKAAFIKYGNVLASALLSILVGGMLYLKRKRDGKIARERYG